MGESREVSRRQLIKGTLPICGLMLMRPLISDMIPTRIPIGVAEKASTQTSYYDNP